MGAPRLLQPVSEQEDATQALEPEPFEDRCRHRAGADDEPRHAPLDGLVPTGVDDRGVDAAAAGLVLEAAEASGAGTEFII